MLLSNGLYLIGGDFSQIVNAPFFSNDSNSDRDVFLWDWWSLSVGFVQFANRELIDKWIES